MRPRNALLLVTAAAAIFAFISAVLNGLGGSPIIWRELRRMKYRMVGYGPWHRPVVWRNLQNSAPYVLGPYLAPMHACDIPAEEIIPQSYIVFLHRGYTLEEHKRTIGGAVDFDTVTHIFPEHRIHGLYYAIELEDHELVAVRADIGVDMVECNMRVHLIE